MGYASNSLGLLSDAFHMLFDCIALFIGLIASYVSQLKSVDKEYTFGYSKVEALSGLFNGVFLVFISYNIFCESIERMFEPVRVHDENLLQVSILGFVVNMVGLVSFHDFYGSGCDHDHGAHESHHSELRIAQDE